VKRMIPTIQIHRAAASEYTIHVVDGGNELFELEPRTSIAEALATAARGIGPDLATYAEVRLRGISIGTFAISELVTGSDAIATEYLPRVMRALESCDGH